MTIEAPCLDCGETMRVVVRDGVIEESGDGNMAAYIDIPFNEWRNNRPYS